MNVICKLCAALAVVAAAGCSGTAVREHPQLEQQLKNINSVAVLPPKARVESITFVGERERLESREAILEQELVKQARGALAAKGYGVIDYDFSDKAMLNSDLPFAINRVYKGFARAEKLLYEKPTLPQNEKRSIRADVGLSVNTVNQATGADAVFLMNYAGYEKRFGTAAKDMAAGMLLGLLLGGGAAGAATSSGSSLDMALVDSLSGEVLWSNTGRGADAEAMMAGLPDNVDPAEASLQAPAGGGEGAEPVESR